LRLSLSIPVLAILAATFLLGSCVSNRRLVYLQERDSLAPVVADGMKEYTAFMETYRLQHGDVLNIRVMGQDPVSVQPFNIDNMTNNVQMQVNNTQLYISGYTVDPKGNIVFPLLGDVNVGGKTIAEVSAMLSDKIDKYVSSALVKVKLVSFKVTILGEVRNPGVHYIYNDRATLLEVLGFAGDLTDLGNRKTVKLIRTTENKVRVFTLDLTDRRLIRGNHYFLLPNDVLYVEPVKAKNFRLNLPAISLMISSITTILVIINLIGK
jgi:polysaccharide export outer membrane protein